MVNVNLLQKEVINDDINLKDDIKKTYTETITRAGFRFLMPLLILTLTACYSATYR